MRPNDAARFSLDLYFIPEGCDGSLWGSGESALAVACRVTPTCRYSNSMRAIIQISGRRSRRSESEGQTRGYVYDSACLRISPAGPFTVADRRKGRWGVLPDCSADRDHGTGVAVPFLVLEAI